MRNTENFRIIATNRKAEHNYFLLEKFIAGIILTGTEIKSVKQSHVNINNAYCFFDKNELFIKQMQIPPYEYGSIYNHDEYRIRKLLLNRKELIKILHKKDIYTSIIPTKVIIKKSLAKVEIAIAKGKKQYDKRETIKKRDIERSLKTCYLKTRYNQYNQYNQSWGLCRN